MNDNDIDEAINTFISMGESMVTEAEMRYEGILTPGSIRCSRIDMDPLFKLFEESYNTIIGIMNNDDFTIADLLKIREIEFGLEKQMMEWIISTSCPTAKQEAETIK